MKKMNDGFSPEKPIKSEKSHCENLLQNQTEKQQIYAMRKSAFEGCSLIVAQTDVYATQNNRLAQAFDGFVGIFENMF